MIPPPSGRRPGRRAGAPRNLPRGVSPSSGAWRDPPPLTGGTRIAEFIPVLMQRVQKHENAWRDALDARWAELMGARYAAHAQPGDYTAASRMLVVEVDHPVLAFEAARELRDLADRIRAAVPSAPVRRVHFRYAPRAPAAPKS